MVVGTTVKRGDLHIKYRSPQQEHQFGYPYQLGHQETADHPQDAMLTHISVRVQSSLNAATEPSRPSLMSLDVLGTSVLLTRWTTTLVSECTVHAADSKAVLTVAQCLCCVQVMPGDICVLGSDGLFDNVSEEEMLEEARPYPLSGCPAAAWNSSCLNAAKCLQLRPTIELGNVSATLAKLP